MSKCTNTLFFWCILIYTNQMETKHRLQTFFFHLCPTQNSNNNDDTNNNDDSCRDWNETMMANDRHSRLTRCTGIEMYHTLSGEKIRCAPDSLNGWICINTPDRTEHNALCSAHTTIRYDGCAMCIQGSGTSACIHFTMNSTKSFSMLCAHPIYLISRPNAANRERNDSNYPPYGIHTKSTIVLYMSQMCIRSGTIKDDDYGLPPVCTCECERASSLSQTTSSEKTKKWEIWYT